MSHAPYCDGWQSLVISASLELLVAVQSSKLTSSGMNLHKITLNIINKQKCTIYSNCCWQQYRYVYIRVTVDRYLNTGGESHSYSVQFTSTIPTYIWYILWVPTPLSMRHGQSHGQSCGTIFMSSGGFAHTDSQCLCCAQAPQFNWVCMTVILAASYSLCMCVCVCLSVCLCVCHCMASSTLPWYIVYVSRSS